MSHITGGSTPVLASVVLILTSVLAIGYTVPPELLLPALALVATALASIAGVTASVTNGNIRDSALTCAGIFALAAIAAAITGDADQVALLVK